MEKNKNIQQEENKLYKFWEENGFFKADPKSNKPHYSLLMPPPNLTGDLHLGHAMQHAILDAVARFKRMQGFDVLLLPGVDHAGIQFEGTLTKLLAKEGLTKEKLGREAFLERAWDFRNQVYRSFRDTWQVMGISADWSREVFTLDPKVQEAVLAEFKSFWAQDLLYKGTYIVQWCPKCGTAIEDVEMEYEERDEKLYFISYKIDGSSGFITIATARPETIPADVAIAVYPKHPKYASLVGKQAVNPLTGRLLPIIEDKRVEKDFGTGALKITPGHDLLDYEIGKDNNLPILHVVDKSGRITDLGEDLAGLKIAQARDKAVEHLEKLGSIEKTEAYIHAVPVCERCKTTVEPLISEEWFVKMKPLAKKARENLAKIKFFPDSFYKVIDTWLENIHDWSISRSLWWGHRFPVWYCKECNPLQLVDKDQEVVVSLKIPEKSCGACKKKAWVQDEHVLDTWFSSGMWPLATLGWPGSSDKPEETKDEWNVMKVYFPWSFEITAPEIKFLWISRMVMLSLWFSDRAPFLNMFFHGMIRDLQGRKFSKSLGNGIDPNRLREEWGTDALRMALYTYASPGRDAKASYQTLSERTKNFRNFATKLRNLTRFIIDLKPEVFVIEPVVNNAEDKEILSRLQSTIKDVTKNIEQFQFHLAVEQLYEFTWHEFADVYVEQAKKRREEAQPVLEDILFNLLKLLHPFMPFTTEELYQRLPNHGKSIMIEPWPDLQIAK